MGDMADYATEQGMDEWVAHQIGDCFENCVYCADDEDE